MLIFTPKYFFTLLAVKPGSNLQPCLKWSRPSALPLVVKGGPYGP